MATRSLVVQFIARATPLTRALTELNDKFGFLGSAMARWGTVSDKQTKAVSGNLRSTAKHATLAAGGLYAMAQAAPAIAAVGTALAQASAAGLILPGVLAQGGVAAASLKLGTFGVGKAMSAVASGDAKALEKAMKNLSPAAREFVLTVHDLRPEFDQLRNSAGAALFDGIAQPLKETAKTVMPVVRTGVIGINQEFSQLGIRVLYFFQQAGILRDLSGIMNDAKISVGNLGLAFTPILRAFFDIAAVGSHVFTGLTGGIGGAAGALQQFVRNARDSGQLEGWMRGGLTVLKQMWDTLLNLFNIIKIVFSAANSMGTTFFAVTAAITGQLLAMLRSVEGQNALQLFFATLKAVVDQLTPVLAFALNTLLQVLVNLMPVLPSLAGAFANLALAALPFARDMAALATLFLPMLSSILSTLAPVLAPLIVTFIAFRPVIMMFFGFIRTLTLLSLAMTLVTMVMSKNTIAWKILNFVMKANFFIKIALLLIAVGVAIYGLWNSSAAFRDFWINLWNKIKTVVMAVFDAIKAAILVAWSVIKVVIDALAVAFQAVAAVIGVVIGALVVAFHAVSSAIGAAIDGIVIAFRAVGDAATWLWNTILQPIFNVIGIAARILAAIFTILVIGPIIVAWKILAFTFTAAWNYVLKPIFDVFAAIALWLWNNVLKPTFNGIVLGFQLIGAGLKWVWDNMIKPVFDVYAAVAVWLWDNVLKPTFDAIVFGFTHIGEGLKWVWETMIKPVFDFYAGVAVWLWDTVLKPTYDGMINGFRLIGLGLKWVWDTLLKPVFDVFAAIALWLWEKILKPTYDGMINGFRLIGEGLKWVWDNAIMPVFNAFKNGIKAIGDAFTAAGDWIRDTWDRIKEFAKKPIQWVIDVVWNKGIVPLWNGVAGMFGLDKLAEFHFARGGPIPGAGNQDNVPFFGTPGEYVLSKPAVRSLGGVAAVERLHQDARAGRLAGLGHGASDGAERLRLMQSVGENLKYMWGGVLPTTEAAGLEVVKMFGNMPGGIGGVRPDSLPDHPSGHALDFMTLSDIGLGDRLVNWMLANSERLKLKYLIWQQQINEGDGWSGMADRGSPTQNHRDHVHATFLDGAENGKRFDGGNWFTDILGDLAKKLTSPLRGMLAMVDGLPFGKNPDGSETGWRKLSLGLPRKLLNTAISFAESMVSKNHGNDVHTNITGPVVDQVRQVAARFGWGDGGQWNALSTLVQKESSWDPNAANPNSSARGLFQKMINIHGPVEPTAAGQAEWGLRYIKDRYGDPASALAFHLAHNWYDTGGWLNDRGVAFNGSGKPEAVLNPAESKAFIAGKGIGGEVHNNYYLTVNARTVDHKDIQEFFNSMQYMDAP